MKKITELYKHFTTSSGVSTDTRDDVKNKIFFALSGENFNGNTFASTAIKNGAKICVIDDPKYLINDDCILVDNVLTSLQGLARHHRKESKTIVLAITGSNGKTTTKELISSVLGSQTEIISTKGNFNNHIGVPLTLLSIVAETKIAVVEMGANHIGEINTLCEIALPDIGIITNIGKAHLEGFGSYEGVIEAKNELYSYLDKNKGFVIVNRNDDLLFKLSGNIKRFTYGLNNADIEGEKTNSNPHLQIKWGYKKNIHNCNTKLYGDYNFNNILAAIATGLYFNLPEEEINIAIENYIPKNNRSQQIKTKHNNIIMDAYNANPYSMHEAINSFAECDFDNPWLLLGDMFELGKSSTSEHQNIVNILKEKRFKNVILIGNEFSKTNIKEFTSIASTELASSFLHENKIINANILVKGSRGMKLETLLTEL